MSEHRIRLDDLDVELIVAALRAREAMTTKLRRHRVRRLIERLDQIDRGNPKWRLSEFSQTREEELDSHELS